MGLSKSAQTMWEVAGYALAAYTMYQKLKEIEAIKNDIFPYLSTDQQTILAKYVGAPAPVQPLSATAGVVPTATVAPPSPFALTPQVVSNLQAQAAAYQLPPIAGSIPHVVAGT